MLLQYNQPLNVQDNAHTKEKGWLQSTEWPHEGDVGAELVVYSRSTSTAGVFADFPGVLLCCEFPALSRAKGVLPAAN